MIGSAGITARHNLESYRYWVPKHVFYILPWLDTVQWMWRSLCIRTRTELRLWSASLGYKGPYCQWLLSLIVLSVYRYWPPVLASIIGYYFWLTLLGWKKSCFCRKQVQIKRRHLDPIQFSSIIYQQFYWCTHYHFIMYNLFFSKSSIKVFLLRISMPNKNAGWLLSPIGANPGMSAEYALIGPTVTASFPIRNSLSTRERICVIYRR